MRFKSVFLAFFACFILCCKSSIVAEETTHIMHSHPHERIAYLKRLLLDARNNHRLPHEVVIYTNDSDDIRDVYEEALEDYPSIIPIFKKFPPFHHHKSPFYDREIFVPTGIPDRELVFIDSVPNEYPDFYDPFWEPFFDTFWTENIPLFEGWFEIREHYEPLKRPFFEPHWKEFREKHPKSSFKRRHHMQNTIQHHPHQTSLARDVGPRALNPPHRTSHKNDHTSLNKHPSRSATFRTSRIRAEQRKNRLRSANERVSQRIEKHPSPSRSESSMHAGKRP